MNDRAPLAPAALAALAAVALAACGGGGGGGGGGGNTGNGDGSCIPACPAGYTCSLGGCVRDSTGTDGGTPTDGGSALTCDMAQKPVGASALATGVQRLGEHAVGETVAFDVPADAVSVTIVEQAVSAPDNVTATVSGQRFTIPNTAVPLTVRDPSGVIFSDAPLPPGSPDVDPESMSLFFQSQSPATGTVTYPNTAKALADRVRPGRWSVQVSDYAYECATGNLITGATCPASTPGRYDVTVLTKSAAGGAIPASGNLEFDVYFLSDPSSGAPLSEATAATDPDLQRFTASLTSIFSQVGIRVAAVRFHDLPAAVRTQYAAGVDVDQTGACAQLPQLLKYAQPGNGMNIFLANLVAKPDPNTPGSEVVGVDGTIPGPASIGGTVASGAAVSPLDLRAGRASCTGALTFRCGADETAYVAAHETGHFLGLYHVTESDGTAFDSLADTDRCPCRTCAATAARAQCADATPAPRTTHPMSLSECTQSSSCGGGNNLMFWLAGGRGELSGQQKQVMVANPLVQ